ncbi:DeoR/GlpR family DNA-binding transcription regulator [Eubacterium barkeri]|uniref:Lactose phosphotransferase system repressor n=1 Tax=Eubacterium barkeri TaxID=1528 RepID=A0A1H3G1P9_EUBBA|nr:DeoR/GlpR family DNA-binding transcription regulator [Eubacterium barkeri]SDX97292.1 DNA-binding transcriptional regulator of sugar metabolism, DeoR/GlpR family [Eubacterium barkeri]
MKKRHTEIIEIVSQRKKIEVNELAELLSATTATIRKDLSFLSEKGILRRERGFALLQNSDDINYRMAFNFEKKRKIARYAAQLVHENETILLESGSTCALFAEAVVAAQKNVTFITNSAYIANFIQKDSDTTVILLGGTFQKHTQAIVGPMTKQCVQGFQVDKIFVGIDGFSTDTGFMGDDLDRADTIRAMAESANHLFVLAESGKFSKSSPVPYFQLEEVYQLITDADLKPETKEYLESKGIIISIV